MRSYRFAAMAALASFPLTMLLLKTPPTYAADLGGMPKAAAPVAEPLDILSYKGGLYVGVLGGYSAAVFEAENIDFGGQDPFVGVYGGYALVSKGWLFGLEGDYLLSNIQTKTDDAGGFSFKADSDYLASVRARLGITWGPVAFYTTGGVAFMEQTISINGVSDSKDLLGFAVGGGVEAEVTRTLTVRLEAIHYGFDDEAFNLGGTEIEGSNDQTVVRAGIGFKLN